MCSAQAVATASGDATVRLWALADGACLRTFEGHTASVLRVAFLLAGTQARPCTSCFDGSQCLIPIPKCYFTCCASPSRRPACRRSLRSLCQ